MNLFNNKNGKHIGKALTILCSLLIIVNGLYTIGYFFNLFNLDLANQTYKEQGLNVVLTYPVLIYQIIMSLLIVTAAILILKRNKIGLFIYFGTQFIGTIYSLSTKLITSKQLTFPLGMLLIVAWLVYRKKDIFFEPKVIV